jgi:predicted RNA-binding protein associated with RNAse of E/G family
VNVATIELHYRRLPDRTDVFRQRLVASTDDHIVTYLDAAEVPRPILADGGIILEPGAPVIWFTYPGAWYDIGRFHLADETYTGCYANIITPVRMTGRRWETTDLALDVWFGVDQRAKILDEDDFAEAVTNGWIDEITERTARRTANDLLDRARAGEWPPEEVDLWNLERVREALRGG